MVVCNFVKNHCWVKTTLRRLIALITVGFKLKIHYMYIYIYNNIYIYMYVSDLRWRSLFLVEINQQLNGLINWDFQLEVHFATCSKTEGVHITAQATASKHAGTLSHKTCMNNEYIYIYT